MYKYHLEDVEWGEFFIEELFFSSRGNAINLSSRNMDEKLENSYAVISAKDSNNGISGFSKAMKNEKIYNGVITINNNGSVGYSYFHKYNFIASSDVTILTPRNNNINLSKSTLIFITECLQRIAKDKFAYGYKASNNRLNRTKIMLPIDKFNNPNWTFMEEYINERNTKHREELKEYYKYRLLDLIINPEVLTDVEWREVFIEEVAEIYSGKDIYEKERTMGDTPYITATANNNGIGYFVGNNNKTLDSECISVNRNGSVGYAFYHCYEALYGNDTRKLKPFLKNKYTALFIAHAITSQKDKYGYGYKMGTGRLKRQKIMLPVSYGEINYKYMENFIKNIEQKQIKNVLKYLDDYIYIYIYITILIRSSGKSFSWTRFVILTLVLDLQRQT